MQRLIQGDELAAWCIRWLGVKPTIVLLEVAHLSFVTGRPLADYVRSLSRRGRYA